MNKQIYFIFDRSVQIKNMFKKRVTIMYNYIHYFLHFYNTTKISLLLDDLTR